MIIKASGMNLRHQTAKTEACVVAISKKKALKKGKMSLKQKIVAGVVIAVPALVIIAWLIMTVLYHQPLATK
jgi:hypothetical protein